MSQSAQREKARTRASTTGIPPATREGEHPSPAMPGTDDQLSDMATISKTTIDRILMRLDCLDQLKTDLANMNDAALQFRDKHAKDVLTAEQRDDKHARDIEHLTSLLEENRKAKLMEEREHLITKQELNLTKELNRRMTVQINDIENKQRCCNVRVEGLEETDREEIRRTVLDIATAIGVNTMTNGDILAAYRTGKLHTNVNSNVRQKARPVMITFATVQKRNAFYFARTKLRNTERFKRVYINDDVTQLTRKQRDDYKAVANIARDDGVEVRIHSDGLVLDGHKYYLAEPHTLPDKYSLAAAKTVEIGGEIYFSSEHSYLSNFANSPITDDGDVYLTAEHMYQSYKCKQAGDLDRMRRVMAAPTPLEAKRLADAVPETPEWRASREKVMIKVVSSKFDQNHSLAEKLTKTGDMVLNEATHNSFFGIGVPLHAREIKEKSYRGENKLGRILADKRLSLITAQNTG